MEKENLGGEIIEEYCNTTMDSSVGNNMYVNKVWVQCENENCLKWRLLSSEDAAKVNHSEPWYCFMNTDTRHNRCSISEEDFPKSLSFIRVDLRLSIRSSPLGSLVLVKLRNWPSWPGILCPDPFKGKYVAYDLDGNVEQYHIEFLGDPHSRSWINATFVGHYSITLKGKCKNKRSGIKVHCKKHTYSMDVLMKKDWKSVTYQNKMQVSKNNMEKKKPKFRKRKRKAILKCSFENVCSDDALSKENMVVSETEILLNELEQMLQQALEPTATPEESEGERGEEGNPGEKLPNCSPEAPAGSPFENYCEEDYLVIDGLKLKAGECIENITNKFKEIDALMSEF